MAKPRSDAKLLNLPEEQQAQLAEWLLAGMPYHVARQRVAEEFGVTVGIGTFTSFWEEVCAPALLRRRTSAVSMANEVAAAAAQSPGQFDAATIDAIRQRAFELAISPHSAAKDVKALFVLLQKGRDQDLKAEQLQLQREQRDRDLQIKTQQLDLDRERFERETCETFLKWRKSERAIEIADGKATNAEKIEALRQIMFQDLDGPLAAGIPNPEARA